MQSFKDYASNAFRGMGFAAWLVYEVLRGTPVRWHISGLNAENGDSLANVRLLCLACHGIEHAYGPSMTKPVPTKESGE